MGLAFSRTTLVQLSERVVLAPTFALTRVLVDILTLLVTDKDFKGTHINGQTRHEPVAAGTSLAS